MTGMVNGGHMGRGIAVPDRGRGWVHTSRRVNRGTHRWNAIWRYNNRAEALCAVSLAAIAWEALGIDEYHAITRRAVPLRRIQQSTNFNRPGASGRCVDMDCFVGILVH